MITLLRRSSTLLVLLAANLGATEAPAPAPAPAQEAEEPEDTLGEIDVEPTNEGFRELPPFRVVLVATGEGQVAASVHAAVRTDLLGFGRFIIVDDERDADETVHGKITVDVKSIDEAQVVVAGVVQIGTRQVAIAPRVVDGTAQAGRGGHRFVDRVVEAFTGVQSAFAAPLAVVRTTDRKRQAWMFDIDGGEAKELSAAEDVVSSVAFDRKGRPVWARSKDGRPFEPQGVGRPAVVLPRGSLYGLAWSPDGGKLAVSVANGISIGLYVSEGARGEFKAVAKQPIALQPDWSQNGKLAYVGSKGKSRRIYVGTRVVSSGADSSSPTFCEHPEGTRIVWVEHFGKRSRLVVANLDGSDHRVLETKSTKVSSPSCAADGRLVAFVVQAGGKSTPGVYVANLDRWRPRRMADIVGDGLRWSPVRR